MCLGKMKSVSSLWHHLAFMDVTNMTICFALSNHVWWLLSASPLINYKCCLLPCTQYLQEGCKGIYQSLPKTAGANEPWIHLPFNSISIKRTALLICLLPKAKEYTLPRAVLCFGKDHKWVWRSSVKISVWLFQDFQAFTTSLGNHVYSLNSCHYKYI